MRRAGGAVPRREIGGHEKRPVLKAGATADFAASARPLNPSCPGLTRASTSFLIAPRQAVDGRDKPGHDEELGPGVRRGDADIAPSRRVRASGSSDPEGCWALFGARCRHCPMN